MIPPNIRRQPKLRALRVFDTASDLAYVRPVALLGSKKIRAMFTAFGLGTEKARQRYRALAKPGVLGAEQSRIQLSILRRQENTLAKT
jgi:hypothetical protein